MASFNSTCTNNALIILEGLRLSVTSIKRKIRPSKKYTGTTEEICRAIINDCFDSKNNYFRVSPNNFKQFWARDFGMCCESLIYLGYNKEVKQTLLYAMEKYEKQGQITTNIMPNGHPLDFPSHTPESSAYMLHSLILLNDKKLIEKYKTFFSKMAEYIFENDIDKKTGLLRKDKHFSSMKDYAFRQSDCYNNCLLAMFANDLKKIKVNTPLSNYNYKKNIEKAFFKDYFLEDLSGRKILGEYIFASDANIFPFWTKVFDAQKKDKSLFKKIIINIQDKKLDYPWPLKYTTKEEASKKMHIANILCPGYETDTQWIHLGLCYMKIVSEIDKPLLNKYLFQYETLIQKHKTFYEVYDNNGQVFNRLLYKSDEAMLWCSIFLQLYLENKKNT
ncbi:MAG: hypothetical protein WC758_05045 [Candidatus Woesearchaeota archaeon]|jgi:hypothetical protein